MKLAGKSASAGVAMGPLYFFHRTPGQVRRRHIDEPKAELERLGTAKDLAFAQLGELYEKALVEVGEQGAALFEVHQMMLEDEDFISAIEQIINTESVNAEFAASRAGDTFAKVFSEMDDAYMRERAADVKDVAQRLVNCLTGETAGSIESDIPVIVAADDLSPSETVQMDKTKILAFVTSGGATNSHAAILARTMGIPAVMSAKGLDASMDGRFCIVDGSTGEAFVDPDPEQTERLSKKKAEEESHARLLEEYKGKPNKTKDGIEVLVYANIGRPSDLGLVLQNDAGGIGLFRSEFLYLERDSYPTEDELFLAYKTVAQTMAGKRVVFRTLDIGADKRIDYFDLPVEENPALGIRGLRLCLERPWLLHSQLRALYRASAFGKTAIMFPMVSSLWEVAKAKEIAEAARKELEAEGIAFDPSAEIGIMVETPAAAVISDLLAPEVDFFSIGTNDLTQYTLAVDRQNPGMEKYADTRHEAVLRLIKTVADNAHQHGIWVGICGELAADLTLTKRFLEMGIDELSVSPASVLKLRKAVCDTELGS
ncbi:MAG: phosphoenolpyruvate--protein phosphotransferase [Clostridiales bacterium]|jgi:phosphotransferase system enzyme I (PtsI)|nr:phosphoenolpyruvate--protein phosphotransferase [Clostridiales bacterium]